MSCNELGPPTDNDIKEGASQIAAALGTKSCDTSSDITQFGMAANAYVNTPIGDAGMGFNTEYSSALTGTSGCEQVSIASKKFASSVKKIACLISRDKSNVGVKTLNTNTIQFKAGRDLEAEKISLVQKINVKVISTANLSRETKNEISDSVKTAALDVLSCAQDSVSGMGATPQGSKIVAQAST